MLHVVADELWSLDGVAERQYEFITEFNHVT